MVCQQHHVDVLVCIKIREINIRRMCILAIRSPTYEVDMCVVTTMYHVGKKKAKSSKPNYSKRNNTNTTFALLICNKIFSILVFRIIYQRAMIISYFYGIVYSVPCINGLSLFIFENNYGPTYMKVTLFLKKAIYNYVFDLDRENLFSRNRNEMFMEKSLTLINYFLWAQIWSQDFA